MQYRLRVTPSLRHNSAAILAAQAFLHGPDPVFGRKKPTGRPPDVLYHLLGRLPGARVFAPHLRPSVTPMKPKSSLIQGPNYVIIADDDRHNATTGQNFFMDKGVVRISRTRGFAKRLLCVIA